jgi:hypothetical protein
VSVTGGPILFWLWGINAYGVDIPRYDQWHKPADAIVESFSGDLTWPTVIEQHNESRKIFPTLISVTLARLSGSWNVQRELYVGWLLSSVITSLMLGLFWRTATKRWFIICLFGSCFALAMWSPQFHELRLASITFERLLPEVCLLAGVLLWWRRMQPVPLALSLATLAIIAQYSYAGGIVVALIFALLFAAGIERWGRRAWAIGLGIYLCILLLSSLVYFFDYETPERHSSIESFWSYSPVQMWLFCARFLGNPFAWDDNVAFLLGSVSFLLVVVALWAAWALRKDETTRLLSYGWLAVAAYSLGQALLATLMRLPLSLEFAMRQDYRSHALYLPFAALAIIWLWSEKQNRRRYRIGVGFLVIAFTLNAWSVVLHASTIKDLRVHRARALRAKACAQLSPSARGIDACLIHVSLSSHFLERMRQLTEVGAIEPGLASTLEFGDASRIDGAIEAIENRGDHLAIRGYALLDGQPVDAIAVTHTDESQEVIVGIYRGARLRKGLQNRLGHRYRYAGWRGRVYDPTLQSSNRSGKLRAYAVATATNELFPLPPFEASPQD